METINRMTPNLIDCAKYVLTFQALTATAALVIMTLAY